jgi:GNAT superfamily N-acetyltransferase
LQNPRNFAVKETLQDGVEVTIRAVRPDDGERIHRAFRRLAPETVRHRFMSYKRDLTDAELKHITGVDFRRDVALLVTIGSGEDETVEGGASYFALDLDAPYDSAELAFTVEEDFQGRGIAGSLMRHLIWFARRNRLRQFEADVLISNLPMLAVFRDSGLPMTIAQDGETVHVTLSLQPD